MRYITLNEVLHLHRAIIDRSGGSFGVRDAAALESSLAQPRTTFGGNDLYPSMAEKASAPGFSLIQNHPFIDGNKRIGHTATETFLLFRRRTGNYCVNNRFRQDEPRGIRLLAARRNYAEVPALILVRMV